MIHNLQFLHNGTLFGSRQQAIDYIESRVSIPGSGLDSVIGQPLIAFYENAEKTPCAILAIGFGSAIGSGLDRKYFYIDVNNLQEQINELK